MFELKTRKQKLGYRTGYYVVAAKFDIPPYSNLAAHVISKTCIFDFTWLNSNIHGPNIEFSDRFCPPFYRKNRGLRNTGD